ncbi:YceD family protein [Haloferula sp.]|uniref:YceD family protein n=1 Tax=Haloferula sp. TaxID=2497595 RepID=UPI003C70E60A
MKGLIIDLPTLPEEGKEFVGEIPDAVFDLPPKDAKPVGPLNYDLWVQRFESELLLTGSLSASFEFTCVRTLHPFTQTIFVEHAAISLEIGNSSQIDATEALREEVLIHFPTDPRCDDADEPQKCEIDPKYLAVDKPSEDDVKTRPRDEGDDRWSALDALKKSDSEP